jgi:hypothetical protein
VRKTILVLSAVFFVMGCSKDDDGNPKPKTGKLAEFLSATKSAFNLNGHKSSAFTVIDQAGQPLKAEILVGTALNDPFPNNLLQTDASGNADIPADWNTHQPVTVRAKGFVSVTYLKQLPHSMTFKMRPAPVPQRMVLNGVTSGYQTQDFDDQVDFGLIIKGMSKAELLAFDINKVISADNDKFTVAGQELEIPSNVSLPRQKERYMIPITMDKNPYHLAVNQPGAQKIMVLRGRFPFKQVVDEMRSNKNFVDLINEFTLDGGAIRDINVLGGKQTLNLDVSELNFNSKVSVTAPSFASDEIVMGLVAQDMNGVLMPTDVKKFTSGQTMSLKAMNPSKSYVLKVLKRQSDFEAASNSNADRLSAIYAAVGQKISSPFLSLIENPKVQGQQLILDSPKPVAGVVPYATYLVLSELQDVDMNGTTVKVPLHRWEIYADDWINQVDLPQQPLSNGTSPKWRWEVSFLGGVDSAAVLGPDMIQKTTHVTRSSTDF